MFREQFPKFCFNIAQFVPKECKCSFKYVTLIRYEYKKYEALLISVTFPKLNLDGAVFKIKMALIYLQELLY